MKSIKFSVLLIFLIFSGKLFSQTIKPSDLIGLWKWETGTNHTIYNFKSDTIYLQNSNYRYNKWPYKFYSIKNEYFVLTEPMSNGSAPQVIYKVQKYRQGILRLRLFKLRSYDQKTKIWTEKDAYDETATGMIKEKNS
jgi:hypothetical protein